MYEHSSTHPADTTTPAHRAAPTRQKNSPFRRTVLRTFLPAVAAAGLGVAGFAGPAHGSEAGSAVAAGGHSATAAKLSRDSSATGSALTARTGSVKQAAAADFPTWGTRWTVHATADANSPAVGMINKTAPGQDRITADYQVDTGHKVCEGSTCSTFMAHLTGPVSGFLSVVAVDIPRGPAAGCTGPGRRRRSRSPVARARRCSTAPPPG